MQVTCAGHGAACSWSHSATSTFECFRWASGLTGEFSRVPQYETQTHDVLVVGAGGAGLRAAIEAANAGARVGLVCKSLLGKAHTVMAEGGAAAAMGNV